jgi:prenyltransferase beta subunit
LSRAVVGLSICAVLGLAVPAGAASPRADAARRGADWIASQQQDDGGFFTSGQRVDVAAETVAAMVAGGVTGRPVDRARAYLRKNASAGATRGAYTGRIVAGVIAVGADPQAFANTNLVAKLEEQYDEASGAYDTENLFTNLMGANGALAAQERLPDKAIAYILSHECSGGGFGFQNACAEGADVDTTAWAIDLLVAAGQQATEQVARAKAFLLSVQQSDGGFGFTKDKATSADSTGLVLTAIEALDESALKAPWRQSDGDDPVKALLALQTSNGSFRFTASAGKGNALSTTNAVPGLNKLTYPIAAPETPEPVATASAAPPPAAPAAPAPAARTPRPSRAPVSSFAPIVVSPSPSVAPGPAGSPAALGTPAVFGPFAGSSEQRDDSGSSSGLVWTGLVLVAGIAGYGVWWYTRGRATP